MNRNEITSLLKFVDRIRVLFNKSIANNSIDSDWRIFSFVMSNHLENKINTTSSIIQASGLPFATGLRKVRKLIKEKKLIKRSKTKTGKSFSIHPSSKLIKDFTDYLILIKKEFATNLGYNDMNDNYFFGTSLTAGKIISAPSIITNQSKKFKKISFLSNDNPTFKVIKKNLNFFEYILGCKIELELEGDLQRLLEKIVNNSISRKKSKYDIVGFNIPWIGQLANSNCLMPLNNIAIKEGLNLNDFHYSGIRSSSFNNILYGIPIEAIPDLLFYRKDLFYKHNLNPPQTFEELFEACAVLEKENEIESPISWPARKGQPLATSFILAMANYGKPYINLRHIGDNFYDLDSQNIKLKTNFLTDASFKAAKMLKELVNYSPREISSHSNDECVEYYSQGKSAMVINWSSRAHLFELNKNSPAYKKTGYLPRPAGYETFQVSPIGGFSLGIPSNIIKEKIPFIIKTIRNFVSPEFIKYYIEHGSLSSPLFSVVNDPEVRALSPIFNEIDKMEKEEKIVEWARYPLPSYSSIIEEVGNKIFEYIFLNKDLELTLKECQKSTERYLNQSL
ncbi:extracellular solute-binding protein [Alphaproteobacteria bacterium]|nr:extracellular solute-binding protein [Alphaproteobacteria bacterium]